MLDDFENEENREGEEEDSYGEIELTDIEVNLPITEEDLRLAELESIIL